jgi:hypothetical protein
VVRGVGRVQEGARAAKRDPARGLVQLASAEPRPEKKRPKGKPVKPQLPGMPPPLPPGTIRIFPMQLQIGDRMTDSIGEWEVVGRPYTTAGGKNAHVRVQRVSQPGVTEVKMWGAYEKIRVQRASAEGQR